MDQTSATDLLVSGAAATFALTWAIFILVAGWKMYAKAGRPGWTALIPILSSLVLLRIVQRPWWWILLLLVPIVNVVILIVVYADLARAFGRGLGTTLLLVLLTPIAYLILGFGKAQYRPRQEPVF